MWEGPYGEWGSRKNLLSSLDQSLKRMQLDYVDIFYSHRFDPNTPLEETMGALATAVREAKRILAGMGVPLLIHQPRYSMFDRTAEESLFDTLGMEGVGSIVFSPLAQGMLTDRYLSGSAPKGSRAAKNHFLKETQIDPNYLERAKGLNEIAAARGQSLAQLALTWVLRQPTVTSALIGASSVKQLEQNYAAINAPQLSMDELRAIDEFAIHGTGR
jgi:L-glyceraldehyde 3-phosphate reductase